MSAAEQGRLSIVGTPIGNLGDLSIRAANVLLNADAVICEDSRRTGKLLAHIRQLVELGELTSTAEPAGMDGGRPAGRNSDLLVANEHTEYSRIPEVLARLEDGESLALVSDAGMPTVSDPGVALIGAVAEAGYKVEVIPGPTAASAALALSGMSADRYVFEGFLPRKGADRQRRLVALAKEPRTTVVYEAPHRLAKTLRDLAAVCGGDRPIVIARELTKLHEEADRTTMAQAVQRFADESPRGEFVLVVRGAPLVEMAFDDEHLGILIDNELEAGASARDTVATVVAATGLPKRKIYALTTARANVRAGRD